MSCSSLMFSLFLISPCEQGGGTEVVDAVALAMSNSHQPTQDIAQDASRKPAQVLSVFEIEPGVTVLDQFSAEIKAAPATSNKSNRQRRADG